MEKAQATQTTKETSARSKPKEENGIKGIGHAAMTAYPMPSSPGGNASGTGPSIQRKEAIAASDGTSGPAGYAAVTSYPTGPDLAIQRNPAGNGSSAGGSSGGERAGSLLGVPVSKLDAAVGKVAGTSAPGLTIQRNSSAPASVNAHAYAQGNQVHFAPGIDKDPSIAKEEIGHTVQQAQGRVSATMQLHGKNINDDSALEKEAPKLGEQVFREARSQRAAPPPDPNPSGTPSHSSPLQMNGVIQRHIYADSEMKRWVKPDKARKDLEDYGRLTREGASLVKYYGDKNLEDITFSDLLRKIGDIQNAKITEDDKEDKEYIAEEKASLRKKWLHEHYQALYATGSHPEETLFNYYEIQNEEIPDYFEAIYQVNKDDKCKDMTWQKLVRAFGRIKKLRKPDYWVSCAYEVHGKHPTLGGLQPVYTPENKFINTGNSPLIHRGDTRPPWDKELAKHKGFASWTKTNPSVRNRNSRNLFRHANNSNLKDTDYISTSTEVNVAHSFASNQYIYDIEEAPNSITIEGQLITDYDTEQEVAVADSLSFKYVKAIRSLQSMIKLTHKKPLDMLREDAWDEPVYKRKKDKKCFAQNPDYTWKDFLLKGYPDEKDEKDNFIPSLSQDEKDDEKVDNVNNKEEKSASLLSQNNEKAIHEKTSTESRVKKDNVSKTFKFHLDKSEFLDKSEVENSKVAEFTKQEFINFLKQTKMKGGSIFDKIEKAMNDISEFNDSAMKKLGPLTSHIRKNLKDYDALRVGSSKIMNLKKTNLMLFRVPMSKFLISWWFKLNQHLDPEMDSE